MVTAKVTNITKNMRRVSGFLIVIICAVVLHSSCARKVVQSMERTSDTLIIHHSDTLQVYDTIKVISKMETTDSVTDNMVTYVVVDTTGRMLTKYVYRDRKVYHNKDALSANSHASNVLRVRNSKEKKTTINTEQKKVVETSALYEAKKFAFYSILLVAIVATIYYFIYKKRK